MVHHIICPLCSSEKVSLQRTCTDHFVSKRDFTVFSCADCGFLFTQDYPEENEIEGFYESENYISHSDTSEGFSNKLYRFARSFMLRRKKKLIQKITGLKKGTILDIGSGTGYFCFIMKNAGWQVKGIEINGKARNFAKAHFDLDIASPDKISAIESEQL
jgi:2-polyprenyl-3-methyl-5-hydroxy-6-metoxy-1,4-benzoquinol methylase